MAARRLNLTENATSMCSHSIASSAVRPVICAARHWARSGSSGSASAVAAAAPQLLVAAVVPSCNAAAARVARVVVCAAQSAEPAPAAAAAAAAAASEPLPELPPLDDDYEAKAAFSPFANWLVPGRLLAGRYPYVEPSRCATHEQGEAQLTAIIGAGVRTFVSLQDEVPAQEELRAGGVDGFLPYRAPAQLIAASFAPPPPMSVVNGLRNPTLDKFLPARRRADPAAAGYYATEKVAFARWPIVDLGVPTMEQLHAIVDDVCARLQRGERAYLHCWGGRGRAGTVGACVLARLYGLSADEALARVQRAFDTRRDGGRRSPETDEQFALVRAYIAGLGQ